MADKITDLIKRSDDPIFQRIIDTQEGAIGLEESKRSGVEPSAKAIARLGTPI